MPQAKQGGSGVLLLATDGSKFDGTGFENEQIGHTQVASLKVGLAASCALFVPKAAIPGESPADEAAGVLSPAGANFAALGMRATLGEDFKNLAEISQRSTSFKSIATARSRGCSLST